MNDHPQLWRITRRRALLLGAAASGISVLAACAPTTAPAPAKPAEPAAPTAKPADAAKPAEAKPAADAKPTAAAQPAAAAQPTAAQAAPASSGQITINWITPAEVGLERDLYTGFYQDFEKQNPKYKVQVSFESFNDYPLKLVSIMAGGTIPDLIHLNSTILHEYGGRGAVRDLNPYLQKDNIPKDLYFQPLLYQLSDFKTHAQQWAIPKDSGTFGVYYNKDMFDKAGVPYPKKDWTFADFREIAKKLTIDKNGTSAAESGFNPSNIAQWGVALGDILPTSNNWQGMIFGVAGPWFTDDFKTAYFDDEGHVDLMQQLADMRCNEHSIPLDSDVAGQGDPWRNGLVAMTVGHQSQTFFYKVEKKTFNFDITYLPGGKNGQVTSVSCSSYAIPTKAAQPDAAWEFLKFLTSQETQCKITSGKRFASAVMPCQEAMMPDDGIPAGFKEVLVDPLMGRSPVKTMPTMVPPFLNEMRNIWKTEYDPVMTCSGGTIADAAKRVQPQVQELLNKAQSL